MSSQTLCAIHSDDQTIRQIGYLLAAAKKKAAIQERLISLLNAELEKSRSMFPELTGNIKEDIACAKQKKAKIEAEIEAHRKDLRVSRENREHNQPPQRRYRQTQ